MRSTNSLLLICLLVFGLGLLAGVRWFLRGEGAPPSPLSIDRADDSPSGTSVAPGPRQRSEALSAPGSTGAPGDEGPRSVVWPLEIDLDLVDAAAFPTVEGDAIRGALAGVEGRVLGRKGGGVRAEIRVVAGMNRGRVLHCDAEGKFGANDLQPGIAVFEIDGPGVPLAMREARLRQGQVANLNVNHRRPTAMYATVQDEDGQPIAGAEVQVDGQTVTSDAEGQVYYPYLAPGPALVYVRKPGYAHYREELNLSGGTTIPIGRVRFHLRRGADLEIRLGRRVGSTRPATVYVLPSNWRDQSNARGQRTYPWHLASPQPMFGGQLVLEDLPPGRVNVWAFHPGAAPTIRAVILRAGRREGLALDLDPAPMLRGVVTLDGEPARRARVRLIAPDLVGATLRAFGERVDLLYKGAITPPPPAADETYTDDQGRFELTAWNDVDGGGAGYRLEALSADGSHVATLRLKREDRKVDLALEPVGDPVGRLTLDLGNRWLSLPIQVTVNGSPRDPFRLAAGEPLVVTDLPEGSWRFSARWEVETLLEGQRIELRPAGHLALQLPAGALEGQDEEARKRSGR